MVSLLDLLFGDADGGCVKLRPVEPLRIGKQGRVFIFFYIFDDGVDPFGKFPVMIGASLQQFIQQILFAVFIQCNDFHFDDLPIRRPNQRLKIQAMGTSAAQTNMATPRLNAGWDIGIHFFTKNIPSDT